MIVFTKTKDSTIVVAEHLSKLGFAAAALNGDLPQKQRQRTVDQLKSGQLNVLVATDVAARGLDVQRISHVFNYDLPHDSESYIHRIGRTGRAGRSGVAIIFLTHPQRGKLRLIERATKQTIEVVNRPSVKEINASRVTRFKEQIKTTLESQDVTFFQQMVNEVAAESGKPLDAIAAAVALMAQGNRPFCSRMNRVAKQNAGIAMTVANAVVKAIVAVQVANASKAEIVMPVHRLLVQDANVAQAVRLGQACFVIESKSVMRMACDQATSLERLRMKVASAVRRLGQSIFEILTAPLICRTR